MKNSKSLIYSILLMQLVIVSNAQERKPDWEELREHFECPAWFAEARFGIWAHWGAQSQPAEGGGWYARHMYMPDVRNETWGKNAYPYQCKTYGHPSEKGFKEVIHAWKAEKLNADSLMGYFKSIGAKYFLIMANHHDHFDNFNSTYHPWNSVNVGPKRDIVGEFEKAARKNQMPFGVSSHDDRFMDWWLPAFGHDETGPYANIPYDGNMTKEEGAGQWWEGLDPADLYGLPPAKRTPEWVESVKRNWVERHAELVTKYDVDLLWFDGHGFPYNEYGKELCTTYYNHRMQKDGKINALVAGKFTNEPSTIKDIECGGANEILPEVWQGTLTPNSWFYKTERPLRHNARTIIEMLIDMNSKNGNLLLNVELRPDGTIPEEHKVVLDEVGAWLNLNSEAIYGSKPWKVYGDNLNSIAQRLKNEKNPSETDLEALKKMAGGNEQFNERTLSSPLYGSNEVRFTTKGDILYLFVLNPEEGLIKLSTLGLQSKYNSGKIKTIQMIGGDGMSKFTQDTEALLLHVPSQRPNKQAVVFKIVFVPDAISGIYPRLAYYNNEGECGTGAVVPWADRLWVITYGPHLPYGSSDKLYEVTPDYRQIVREESTGGTPANRMVHQESNQLFIGPYAIDTTGNVRVIPYSIMPGRHTGNARHLTNPVGKIYYGTMEEGFYEVDVNTLDVKELYQDGNSKKNIKNDTNDVLPGVHGKGLYSGQGVLLFTNNGEGTQEALKKFDVEAGVLAEWDGKDWKVVRRNQFTEVTGPGDIYGNANPDTDPLWATGWDHKSILLGVRDAKKGWSFYRLPKASHSYDGAHGWNTEWPRIRNVGTASHPDYLMTMHGMFWRFPGQLTVDNSAGIRPRSAYLKVVGDFTRWNDQLVFGCDDSAQKEFLNKRKAKGNMEGPGQSNSNLWFTSFTKPDELGPATAEGAVWTQESVKANEASEPFLFAGWSNRIGWIKNQGKQPVTFFYEVDETGTNEWKTLKVVTLNPGKSASVLFSAEDKGEWIRLKADKATSATASFSYTTSDIRSLQPSAIYKGLASATETNMTGGLLYGLGDNRRALGLLANTVVDGNTTETGYYEMGDKLELVRKEDAQTANLIRSEFAIPQQAVSIENSSVLIVDDLGRRWRLPLGDEAYASLTNQGKLRVCREVATERDLFSCMGTFYELPAENADGYAKIRPVSTHNYHINDYASYRGMLILSGVKPEEGTENEHIIVSNDGKAAVWVGVIDDLWQLGKPVGKGGPWKDTEVKAGVPSDPYLIGFYDKKELMLSHQSVGTITFTIEVDPTGNGDWMEYLVQQVKSGEKWVHEFPEEFQSRWIRCSVDTDTKATTWLEYK